MPYKDPEKRREYIRLYMRDRRAKEKAEAEEVKLPLVTKILVAKYSMKGYKPEPVVPRKITWTTLEGLKISMTLKPSLTQKILNIKGEGKVTQPAPPEKWVPYIKSVLKRTKKRIVDKQTRETVGSVSLPECRVIMDFRNYMKENAMELRALEWQARFDLLAETMYDRPSDREKWRQMRMERKTTEEALVDFAIEGFVDHKTDEEIIREARYNDRTRHFWRVHGFRDLAETWAKSVVKDVRRCLPSLENSD